MSDDKNTSIYVAYEDHDGPELAGAERGLLRAILAAALADLRKDKKGDEYRRASEYLLSAEEDYIFSFRSICSFLDIDPGRVLVVTGLRTASCTPSQRSEVIPEKSSTT